MLKPFKIPETKKVRKPKGQAHPKPESTDLKIPFFSVEGLTIQGKPVGSTLEYNIAAALDLLEIGYKYQVWVLGGRIRGGSVVDFEVYTLPVSTFVFAQGDYWHTRGNKEDEDQFLFSRIESTYHKKVVQIWEHQCLTVQMAMQVLKAELRL